MMLIRARILEEARQWIDTPYKHQACVKQIGCDCAQLIAGVALNVGLITKDDLKKMPAYSSEWHLHNREEKLRDAVESFGCVEVNINDRVPGDVVGFRFGRVTSHLGILGMNNKIIHARLDIGKTVIGELTGEWERRMSCVYRLPGVE